ncbi:hypothetical protein A9P44_00380 [Paenibacillus polymyxa]|nr:hypothetical protein [Paenibacillus polymyxa]OBA07843.1 hypothetical protein A9P44_00380 [Paenibacillus polymyxa]
MYINSIIDYRNGYKLLQTKYRNEYNEVLQSIEEINFNDIQEKIEGRIKYNGLRRKEVDWERKLNTYAWNSFPPRWDARINTGLDVHKNSVSASLNFYIRPDRMNTTFYSTLPFVIRHTNIEVLVFIILQNDLLKKITHLQQHGFETLYKYYKSHSPLEVMRPFIVIGINSEPPLDGASIVNLEYFSSENNYENNTRIIRTIEFPHGYYHAGVGILSYFDKILREKHPDSSAKVKIIQEDLIVKMVIETGSGDKEIIEKTLNDYGQVVSGRIAPQDFLDTNLQVIELRAELNIAATRIKMQEDLLRVQETQIEKLLEIVGDGLRRSNDRPIQIAINNSNYQETNIQNEVGELLRYLTELKENSEDDEVATSIDEINEIASATSETEDVTKNPDFFSRIKGLLEKISGISSTGNETIAASSTLIRNIILKYNAIAKLVGLATIPFN